LGWQTPAHAGGNFDFYVLSLSWSPTWCAGNDSGGRTAQCSGQKNYGFIVHGLWPQNERGWPEDCQSNEPDRVPDNLVRTLYDILPSAGLMGHEWRKHGTCSGLSQTVYFGTMRAAFGKIQMPPVIFDGTFDRQIPVPDLEKLMMRANPGLRSDGITVTCDGNRLSEIRICMTKSLQFRACGEPDHQSCPISRLNIPAIP
jgi:ribonuclease T2